MAPIGTIVATTHVAKQESRGMKSTVTGTITLKYTASGQSKLSGNCERELFGPLRIAIILHGQARLKVLENRTSHAYILFSEVRQLFRKRVTAFNGPFRASPDSVTTFPFQITFPEHTESYRGIRSRLPPNFHARFRSNAVKQAGYHQGVVWLDYLLNVEVDMPGISIDVKSPSEIPMSFEPPSIPWNVVRPAREFQQRQRISTFQLLSESERPNGIFNRTVAALKQATKPVYSFNVICAGIPEILHVGVPTSFVVRVRPDAEIKYPEGEAFSPESVPDIVLGDCEVELLARTQIFATNEHGIDSPKLDNLSPVANISLTRLGPRNEPFGKPNDFTKMLKTGPIPQVPISFCIAKVERSYSFRVILRFLVAGQIVTVKKELPVVIFPKQRSSVALPSSSRIAFAPSPSYRRRPLPEDEPYDDEALPVYEPPARPAVVA